MTRRLLIVEDDLALRTGLEDAFEGEGYDVTVAADGNTARDLVFSRHFDAVILDLMLPGRSGWEILKEVREQRFATPVLLLTARGDESDKVLGLDLGADDYVTKPFGLRELIARVRAMLRRHDRDVAVAEESAPPPDRFRVGDVDVDLAAFELRNGGVTHSLSRKEAAMLSLLYSEAGRAVSRERFLNEVWDGGEMVGNRTIDTHVLNLRHKIEPDPAHPRHLLTVHGIGYRLQPQAQDS